MRSSLATTIRGVVFLALPATFGLILLGKPVVAAFYQRGEFTSHSTDLVAWALLWYTAGLVGHSVVEIVSRSFYALHDTKTPVFVGAGAMSLNLVFSVAFAALFERIGWAPHGGLALANSVATTLEMIGLLFLMQRRLKGLEGRKTIAGIGRSAAATLVMSLSLWLWMSMTNGQPSWLVAAGGVILGTGIFILAALLFRVEEAREIFDLALRRLRGQKLPGVKAR